MKLLALIRLTLRELAAKATIIILAAISTIVLLGLAAAFSTNVTPDGMMLQLFGQQASPVMPEEQLITAIRSMQAGLAGGLFTGIILFGIFATAGVIPDALEKGTVDLYLSKPIARWELLLGKYLGALVAIFVNVLYFMVGAWLIFGLKCHLWDFQILLATLTITFMFACLYAIVAFLAVLTRNTAVSIILVYLYLFVVGPLLHNREATLYLISENTVYRSIVDGFYYVFPQLDAMRASGAKQLLAQEMDWKPFVQSLLSASVFFFGGAVMLKRRDF
jgi:ABC-type transport system involved in multi-copper enzyme maturation permease subunit